jgi:hypothetical protein
MGGRRQEQEEKQSDDAKAWFLRPLHGWTLLAALKKTEQQTPDGPRAAATDALHRCLKKPRPLA